MATLPLRSSPETVSALDHILALHAAMDLRYQQRFEAQETAMQAALTSAEKAVQAALAAADKATEKAEREAKVWREASNEWREAMTDRERKFVSAEVFAETIAGLRTEVRTRGLQATFGYVVGFIGIISATVAIVLALAH